MINGSILRIIPGKFLIFDAPDPSIPADKLFQDVGGRRRFTPGFYADLLHHLGVRLVLRLGAADYDPAPFARRGIRVCGAEDVECVGGSLCGSAAGAEAALGEGAFDRFAALAQAAGGSVAVHGGWGGGGLRVGLTLIAGWMMQHQYFASPDVAAAWIRIALGAAAPVDRAALRRHLAARRAEDDRRRAAAAAAVEPTRSASPDKPRSRHGSPGRAASSPVLRHASAPGAARHRSPAPAGAFSLSSPPPAAHPVSAILFLQLASTRRRRRFIPRPPRCTRPRWARGRPRRRPAGAGASRPGGGCWRCWWRWPSRRSSSTARFSSSASSCPPPSGPLSGCRASTGLRGADRDSDRYRDS